MAALANAILFDAKWKIIHEECDIQKRIKASAVTTMQIDHVDYAMFFWSQTVILERPFVYAITKNKTKLPVFIGMVNHL